MKHYGLLLLGIWLISHHLLQLISFHFSHDKFLLTCIALTAGILLLVHELRAKLESIGTLLLGLWLIIGASITLFKFSFPSSQLVMAILASLAGLLLIIRK